MSSYIRLGLEITKSLEKIIVYRKFFDKTIELLIKYFKGFTFTQIRGNIYIVNFDMTSLINTIEFSDDDIFEIFLGNSNFITQIVY